MYSMAAGYLTASQGEITRRNLIVDKELAISHKCLEWRRRELHPRPRIHKLFSHDTCVERAFPRLPDGCTYAALTALLESSSSLPPHTVYAIMARARTASR